MGSSADCMLEQLALMSKAAIKVIGGASCCAVTYLLRKQEVAQGKSRKTWRPNPTKICIWRPEMVFLGYAGCTDPLPIPSDLLPPSDWISWPLALLLQEDLGFSFSEYIPHNPPWSLSGLAPFLDATQHQLILEIFCHFQALGSVNKKCWFWMFYSKIFVFVLSTNTINLLESFVLRALILLITPDGWP